MISRNIVMAREAIRAFNEGWLDCLSSMLSADATYVDEARDITVHGVEDFKRTARELRLSLPRSLRDTTFEDDGTVVRARATVTSANDFMEVLEFDAAGKITKITATYHSTIAIPEPEIVATV